LQPYLDNERPVPKSTFLNAATLWRRMGSRTAVLLVVVLLAALSSSSGLAASRTVTLRGFEIGATPTAGTFAGTGSSKTAWTAVVRHTRIERGQATIKGGSFRLASAGSGGRHVVRGTFTGGTVALISQAPGCGAQVYAVHGRLALPSGAGSMTVRLTHHRRSVLGRCVAYSATVKGTAQL
jgi:hypothetical protein